MANETQYFPELYEDKIQLYRRTVRGKLNLTWQARILTSGKGRVRISTKEQNIKRAERIAISKYQELEARVQNNLPIERYRFRYAAIRYLEELIKEEQGHTPKYLSQHSLIANQLIPYFNNTFLDMIDTKLISDYLNQRVSTHEDSRKGQKVSSATLNKDLSVISGVLKNAKLHKWIQQIPDMPRTKGFKRRASFTTDEAEILKEKLNEWCTKFTGDSAQHIPDYKRLFKLYCLTIYYAGIRPGKEMASLMWQDVEYGSEGNQEFVKLRVTTSKRQDKDFIPRQVIALPRLKVFIDKMKDTHLYKEYGPMFAHPQSALEARHIGKPINSFRKQWDSFMQWSGLQYENRPPYRRRPLYSLRHLYMEQRLIHGEVDLYALATNYGTSPEVI